MVLLIFAEGTRKTPEKFKASQEFALSRGMEPFKHHLVPRTKGFVHTIRTLDPEKVTAIYDVTLGTNEQEGHPATFGSIMAGKATVAEAYVRRIETRTLHGKTEAELEQFVMDLYRKKDDLMDNYLSTGSFTRDGKDPSFEDFPSLEPPARLGSLLNVLALNFLVAAPLVRLLLSMLSSGSTWQVALAVAAPATLFAVMHKMLDMTKASKGSTYGAKKKD